MIEKYVYQLFIRYLKEKNIYENYINNIKNYENTFYDFNKFNLFEVVEKYDDFFDVFDWSETIEGFDFWSTINNEWDYFLSNTIL